MKDKIFFYLITLVIGCLGAFVKYVNQEKKVTTWLNFIGQIISGGFVALVAGTLTQEFFANISEGAIFALCGVYGFAGISVFDFIIKAIKQKIVNNDNDSEKSNI